MSSILVFMARSTDGSTSEHLVTVQQGFAMFLSHPVFGAGLGAYIGEQIRTTGTPLIIHSTPVWLLAETGLVGFRCSWPPHGESLRRNGRAARRVRPGS